MVPVRLRPEELVFSVDFADNAGVEAADDIEERLNVRMPLTTRVSNLDVGVTVTNMRPDHLKAIASRIFASIDLGGDILPGEDQLPWRNDQAVVQPLLREHSPMVDAVVLEAEQRDC